jgi:hypothetical protein
VEYGWKINLRAKVKLAEKQDHDFKVYGGETTNTKNLFFSFNLKLI